MFLSASAAYTVANGRGPPLARPRDLSAQVDSPPENLPAYSENPEYETVPHPEAIARKAVKDHEKRLKQDLKEAGKAETQCARIKLILPQLYAQLNAAADAPRVERARTGPAALRPQREPEGVEVSFKSRGIDQKALRRYLPALLADYQLQMESGAAGNTNNTSIVEGMVATRPTMVRSATVPASTHTPVMASGTDDSDSNPPALTHATTATANRRYNPDLMSVKAGYFEEYTQKIYFSKDFIQLWKKKDGKREGLAGGIAMILIGIKLGLPIFDLFTFVALDCPRLALQRITGKQTLKLRD